MIPLLQGKVALVDDADYERLVVYSWHAASVQKGTWYAARKFRYGRKVRTEYMHDLLMGCIKIDHQNGNGLDNQRRNLRPATSAQNAQNRRKRCNARGHFKGVTLRKSGKWEAGIKIGGRNLYLGTFDAEEQAAAAYRAAAKSAFGEFARF